MLALPACCRFDGMWVNDKATCGTYSEIEAAAPGVPGSLPNVELAEPDAVLQQAVHDMAAAAAMAATTAAHQESDDGCSEGAAGSEAGAGYAAHHVAAAGVASAGTLDGRQTSSTVQRGSVLHPGHGAPMCVK